MIKEAIKDHIISPPMEKRILQKKHLQWMSKNITVYNNYYNLKLLLFNSVNHSNFIGISKLKEEIIPQPWKKHENCVKCVVGNYDHFLKDNCVYK